MAKFFDRIFKQPVSGCWLWTGNKDRHGYGRLYFDGKVQLAHRASYQIHNGAIPAGMLVLHSCDTPACCNPDHLSLGTHADNMLDMHAKRRHPKLKLTDEHVREIREKLSAGHTHARLAGEYKISRSRISQISSGRCRRAA